ncbi:MAG: hypothetical protein WCX28_08040, partial [Bacteriovoracaceae bacterium]
MINISKFKIAAFLGLSLLQLNCREEPITPQNDLVDSTSHTFNFVIETFGDGGGSSITDIDIINDSNAYAVGEIFTRDSLGNIENQPYNVFRYDGKKWHSERIKFQLFNFDCTVGGYYYGLIKAVFAFNPISIVFTDGASVVHFDGQSYTYLPCSLPIKTGVILKIWGLSIQDFYAVGTEGMILRFHNGVWKKIDSGTQLPINDIWGDSNSITGETEIMCLASNKSQNNGRKIIRIIDQQSTKHLSDEGLPWSLSGLWFDSKQKYFAVGDGFYCSTSLDQTWQAYTISADYKTSIRGNSINDIFVSGIHMLL